MSTTKTWAGSTYNLPLNREPKSSSWGTEVSNFLIALADNALSKTGGTYTLTSELSFGATYGVLAAYIKSASANIASAGVLRLANLEAIKWRNAANSADVSLSVSAANRLTVDAVVVPTVSSADALTNKTLVVSSNTVTTAATGNLAATELNAALAELQTDIDTRATSISPTLTTPALGTPSSGVMTNVTGLPLTTGVTGTLPVANGGTGVTTSTGSGSTVLSTSPTLASPAMTGALTITEGSAPSSPASGKVALYAKTDNRLYLLDSGGTESPAGAGLTPTYKAANFTAVAGSNYLVNTTSGAITATLPAGSSFATIRFTDDLGTWGGTGTTLTITPAGAETIQGVSGSLVCNVAGSWVELNWDPTNGKWIYSTNGYASTVGPTTAATNTSFGLLKGAGAYQEAGTFGSAATINIDTAEVTLQSITITNTGRYLVIGNATFNNSRNTALSDRAVGFSLYVNSTIKAAHNQQVLTGSSTNYCNMSITRVLSLTAGDVVTIRGQANAATIIAAHNYDLVCEQLYTVT